MGRWILIGFGIIALTTGFVLYMALRDRADSSPETLEAVEGQMMPAPQIPRTETQNLSPTEQAIPIPDDSHSSIQYGSQGGAEWKTRGTDTSQYRIDRPEDANAAAPVSASPTATISEPEVETSGSIEPEQGMVGEPTIVGSAPFTDSTSPGEDSVPIHTDPMSDVSGTLTGIPLPGEGEPPYTGPLPGEGEPDYVGPLPGENEPPYIGPLPGENELPATGPLPGEEG